MDKPPTNKKGIAAVNSVMVGNEAESINSPQQRQPVEDRKGRSKINYM
jgi:hypothetical protein